MSNYIGKTIEELHELLVSKKVTPLELAKEVIEEIKRENTKYFGVKISDFEIKSIFIGGGTPTVLESRSLGKIMDVILNKYNVTIHRTDEEGTILMHLKGNDITFENFKTETNG